MAEEVAALQDPNLYRLDPGTGLEAVKPRTSNKRFLAVLAALAAWREREAQARDIPRGRVLEGRGPDRDRRPSAGNAAKPWSASALCPKGFANSQLGKGLTEAIAVGLHRRAGRKARWTRSASSAAAASRPRR